MGLDMYLDRKRVLSWEDQIKMKEEMKVENPVISVEEEVAYWRKANQINKFFMKRDIDGEGRQAKVDINDLKELLKICKRLKRELKLVDGKIHTGTKYTKEGGVEEMYADGKIIANKELAEELLPTEAGFFFGSTDYDEWYYKQIVETIPVLEKIISEHNDAYDMEYSYYASWQKILNNISKVRIGVYMHWRRKHMDGNRDIIRFNHIWDILHGFSEDEGFRVEFKQ